MKLKLIVFGIHKTKNYKSILQDRKWCLVSFQPIWNFENAHKYNTYSIILPYNNRALCYTYGPYFPVLAC